MIWCLCGLLQPRQIAIGQRETVATPTCVIQCSARIQTDQTTYLFEKKATCFRGERSVPRVPPLTHNPVSREQHQWIHNLACKICSKHMPHVSKNPCELSLLAPLHGVPISSCIFDKHMFVSSQKSNAYGNNLCIIIMKGSLCRSYFSILSIEQNSTVQLYKAPGSHKRRAM